MRVRQTFEVVHIRFGRDGETRDVDPTEPSIYHADRKLRRTEGRQNAIHECCARYGYIGHAGCFRRTVSKCEVATAAAVIDQSACRPRTCGAARLTIRGRESPWWSLRVMDMSTGPILRVPLDRRYFHYRQ